jgi:hypothetical protein
MIMNILKNTVIALAIGLAFTACNNKGNKQSGEAAAAQAETVSSAELKETNAGNWQAVAKENFKLDLTLPAGWTVTKAESPNGQNMMLFCEIDNADSLDGAAKLASVKSFVQAALEASKAASAGAFNSTAGDVEIVPGLSWQWEYTHEPVTLSQEYVATTTMLTVNYNNLNSIEISIALMAKRI